MTPARCSAPSPVSLYGSANSEIQAGLTNSDGQYVWAVPSTLGDDETYGFRINLESDESVFQYSFPFKIDGTGAKPSGSDDDDKPTATTDCTTATPEPTVPSNSTTLTSTFVEQPTEEPEPEEPEVEEPETDEPAQGAASANVVGTFALFGAAAVAAFAL